LSHGRHIPNVTVLVCTSSRLFLPVIYHQNGATLGILHSFIWIFFTFPSESRIIVNFSPVIKPRQVHLSGASPLGLVLVMNHDSLFKYPAGPMSLFFSLIYNFDALSRLQLYFPHLASFFDSFPLSSSHFPLFSIHNLPVSSIRSWLVLGFPATYVVSHYFPSFVSRRDCVMLPRANGTRLAPSFFLVTVLCCTSHSS